MDNLSSHTSQVAEEAVRGREGKRVVSFSAYSPDLNPMETMWSKANGSFEESRERLPIYSGIKKP